MSGPSPAQRASLARFAKSSLPRALWQLAQHPADFPRSVGCHGLDSPCRIELPVDATARFADGRLVRTALHPATRLQPRLVLRELPRQSLARRRPGAAHAVPVRLLEEDARRTSRHLGQSRPARARRHPHNDCDEYRAFALDALLLPLLPQHARDARHRAVLPVRRQAPTFRSACRGLEKRIAQRGSEQSFAARGRRCLVRPGSTGARVAVHLPVVAIAGAIGVWLFYVQHCFEDSYWVRCPDWDPKPPPSTAARYDLPAVLRWVTGNIGYHHIHHLAPRIPNYHLRAATRPPRRCVPACTWTSRSLACARMKLWDENLRRMVGSTS